jgi:predicted type IV restriction endonuclease
MDFLERVKELGKKISDQRGIVQTEEAAKTSFVMPFLQTLGYEVFNAAEVIPEFIADWAAKKGEKVDYMIKVANQTVMLIECKQANDALDASKESQLANYFHHVQECNIGVLTNGIVYKFYTDLNAENIMDTEPFFVFDFGTLKDGHISKLEMFSKANITKTDVINSDIIKIRNYAAAVEVLRREFANPSEDLVKYVIKQMPFIKRANETVVEEFREHIKKAVIQFEQDFFDAQIARLKETTQSPPTDQQAKPSEIITEKPAIQTTVEEMQALAIVCSLLYKTVPSEKIVLKDSENYCDISYATAGSPRIVRLHFNDQNHLFISFPGNPDLVTLGKVEIKSVEKLNEHSDKITSTVSKILSAREQAKEQSKKEPKQPEMKSEKSNTDEIAQ